MIVDKRGSHPGSERRKGPIARGCCSRIVGPFCTATALPSAHQCLAELTSALPLDVYKRQVLRQPESRLRNAVALAIAVLPVVFITYDRPEALALVLFCVTIGAATASGSQPAVVGLFIALTFLAHPFVAVTAAIWASALVL